jgi:hypothetical protein
MNWQELATTSHYRTAVAVGDAIQRGETREAATGIEELIEALTRADKRALKSHLIRLMVHVIKWHTQPQKRSRSWRATINNARREIADIQEDTPSLNRSAIEAIWDDSFDAAVEEAEGEMNQESELKSVSWGQLFEDKYEIAKSGKSARRKRT